MSDEKTNTTDQNTDQQSQPTAQQAETNMVPSYRLKEEADKRRSVQAELDEFKKDKQTREDADLSKVEKLTKERDTAVADLTKERATVVRNTLNSQITQKLVEAKLDPQIAKVAAKAIGDLSDDNIDSKVKETIKEFSNFVKKDEKETPTVINPYVSVQPGTGPTKDLSDLTPDELVDASLARSNKNKI